MSAFDVVTVSLLAREQVHVGAQASAKSWRLFTRLLPPAGSFCSSPLACDSKVSLFAGYVRLRWLNAVFENCFSFTSLKLLIVWSPEMATSKNI